MTRVLSRLNRFYAALENSYGAPAAAAAAAFRALNVDLELAQQFLERRDKSGSRTFEGAIAGGRRSGRFQLDAYLMGAGSPGAAPDLAPLYQAACGGVPRVWAGGTAASGCTQTEIALSAPHSLEAGQAIGCNGELRFVTAVLDSFRVTVTPGFSSAPSGGAAITGSVAFPLALEAVSVSIFDYWDPATAQQRILAGAFVDQMKIAVEGDFHTVTFSGEAQDLIDSITFVAGQGGLGAFPPEPAARVFHGQPIAGQFGQLWLGASPARFQTLLTAQLVLDNDIELRDKELGFDLPQGAAPGDRGVRFDFELFETDDAAAQALYTAARARTPVQAFLQLGAVAGHMFGAYMKSLYVQPPKNDARERELKWLFTEARAAGADDDELWIAFG